MSDDGEIRIAAYTGILTEGPCMRSGCVNRLRRIVELEDSLKRLDPPTQLLRAREALGCHENVDIGYACREAVKDRDHYKDECARRAASEARLIEALRLAVQVLDRVSPENDAVVVAAQTAFAVINKARAALKGAE